MRVLYAVRTTPRPGASIVPDVIRILIAEDQRLVREALTHLLNLEQGFLVAAAVATGDEILPAALRHRPDVAMLDIGMPGTDGLTAAARLVTEVPACRVLMLTSTGRPGELRRALSAQVHGFMLKDAAMSDLVNAVRRVHAGLRVIAPDLAAAAWEAGDDPLSQREREILRLAAEGQRSQEIARVLSLSPGTVRNHLGSVVGKLHARNHVDAVRIAERAGWL